MAARVYDIYDLSSPFVSATAQTPTPTTPTTARRTRGPARLLRSMAYLAVLAGVLFLAALLVTVTPLGAIDADITVPFVAVVLGGLALVVWGTVRK